MKFSKTLINNVLQEWRFYSVDYKQMKKALKAGEDGGIDHEKFFELYESSQVKLTKFYNDKENWAVSYSKSMEDRVETLRQTKVSSPRSGASELETNALTNDYSDSASSSIASDSEDDGSMLVDIEGVSSSFGNLSTLGSSTRLRKMTNNNSSLENSVDGAEKYTWLKEEYRKVGKSKHFQNYIYAKKSLDTFARELDLLLEFLDLNYTGFSKILKKYDKINGSAIRESKMTELIETHSYLKGSKITQLRERMSTLIEEVKMLKPDLPDGWGQRKVYTIGCFDLFHRGHQNVLISLREFGYYIVAGIHDDTSYFKLKNKYTIDNIETRMRNVKPFVDQIYVIPSTDPELYLKSMVSEQDILSGKCCYARGDDMLQFPGREWVESVMPVHFVPRTESCSSTLIRTIYHADDPEIRKKAAFAETRYDGKPIDENGNVLKF
jgi:cytidyltransferase-like protein